MSGKSLLLIVAMCFLVCVFVTTFTQDVHAQESQINKKGIGGLFQSDGKADPREPKKWQIALGVGSIFVMIAVVKWL
jgi:hypothetical protein